MDDTLPTPTKKLPNGGMRIEPVIGSEDGVTLRLHYLIQDRQRGLATKRGYGWGDSVFTYEVLAGQSVIFSVPTSHFRRRFDIAVPFNYSWEGSTSIGMGPVELSTESTFGLMTYPHKYCVKGVDIQFVFPIPLTALRIFRSFQPSLSFNPDPYHQSFT